VIFLKNEQLLFLGHPMGRKHFWKTFEGEKRRVERSEKPL